MFPWGAQSKHAQRLLDLGPENDTYPYAWWEDKLQDLYNSNSLIPSALVVSLHTHTHTHMQTRTETHTSEPISLMAWPGPHLLLCIPRWIMWSNVKKNSVLFLTKGKKTNKQTMEIIWNWRWCHIAHLANILTIKHFMLPLSLITVLRNFFKAY